MNKASELQKLSLSEQRQTGRQTDTQDKVTSQCDKVLNISISYVVIKFMHRQFRKFLHDHLSNAYLNGNRQLLPPAITAISFTNLTTGILDFLGQTDRQTDRQTDCFEHFKVLTNNVAASEGLYSICHQIARGRFRMVCPAFCLPPNRLLCQRRMVILDPLLLESL